MTNIRVQETSDGICTVYIGHQVIVAGLSREEASTLVDAYCRLHGIETLKPSPTQSEQLTSVRFGDHRSRLIAEPALGCTHVAHQGGGYQHSANNSPAE
jgi:hypothetical protein